MITVLTPMVLLVVYAISILQAGIGTLYGYNDIFGPLSRSVLANFELGALVLSTFILGYFTVKRQTNSGLARLSFVVLVTALLIAKYFFPFLAGNFYQNNFPDSFHIGYGEWVAITGRIPDVPNGLLTWQPGFWVTFATFVDVALGPTNNAFSSVFAFLMKWAPLLLTMTFLPCVYVLMRSYDVSSRLSAYSVILFLGLYPVPVWMAEVQGGLILYWLFLASLGKVLLRKGRREWIIFAIISAAVVFVHLGIAIFAATALLAVLALALVVPKYRVLASPVTNSLVVFFLLFLTRMLYNTGIFLGSYLLFGLQSFSAFFRSPLAETLSGGYRPFPLYQDVIFLKDAVYVAIVIIPLVLLIGMGVKRSSPHTWIAAFVIAVTTLVLVPMMIGAGVGTGGVGGALPYIPQTLTPFAALGFALYIDRKRGVGPERHARLAKGGRIAAIATVSMLAIMASYISLAGANYLWYPQSENLGEAGNGGPFLTCYVPVPNPCTVSATGYQGGQPFVLRAQSLYYSLSGDANVHLAKGYYYAYYTDQIGALYFVFGSLSVEATKANQAIQQGNILYSTPTAMLISIP